MQADIANMAAEEIFSSAAFLVHKNYPGNEGGAAKGKRSVWQAMMKQVYKGKRKRIL